jgi:hypothetical protein
MYSDWFLIFRTVNRSRSAQNAASSLHSWDKTVDKFLAWLSEARSTLNCVDNDSDVARAAAQFRVSQAETRTASYH